MTKRTKKLAALLMSVVMVLGSTTTVFATETGSQQDSEVEVDAPIYSYDISNVVVPTELKVAFNPDGHTVTTTTNAGGTSTAQIVSLNYGIINKSSKNKKLTVDFTVLDGNATDGENVITFATSADAVTNATKNDYVVYLTAVPGEVTTTVDKDTEAADLADVALTPDSTKAVALSGVGKLGFILQNANYTQADITLGTDNVNNVSAKFTLDTLNDGSYIGFTFSGSMNTNTNWSGLTEGIDIKAVYGWETTDVTTYGVTSLDTAPSIATTTYTLTADTEIQIAYDLGYGDLGADEVANVSFVNSSGALTTATEGTHYRIENGKVIFTASYVNACMSALTGGSSTSRRHVITFNDDAGTSIDITFSLPIS